MKKNRFKILLVLLIILSAIPKAENKDSKGNTHLQKPTIESSNNFDGNRIDCDMENNGMFVSYNISGRSGLIWPKGNNTQTVFASGVWLGGIVNGDTVVSVGEYGGEYASGPWGADHNDPYHKIYKVSKRDLVDSINNTDIQNWPVEFGAPWVDENKNGTYEPLPNGPDHPEFIGDQVLWMVMNDGVDSLHWVFNTAPLGVEVQRTVFGFDRTNVFGDMMFVKDLIINKGGNTIEEMYVGLWSDPDLGDAGDDFVGCDTTLGMGICYNDGIDREFAGYVNGTPAVGYDFLQGPIVPAPGESAYAFGRNIQGYKNLQMISFVGILKHGFQFYDPSNAIEAYNLMNGLNNNGTKIDDKVTGGSLYTFPGDPTKNVDSTDNEIVDGDFWASHDRRFLMNSGPFNMAPGDSQEVIFAIMHAAAGGWDDSYLKLKEVDIKAQNYYNYRFQPSSPSPPKPQISVTALDDQIILTWNETAENYESENYFDVHPETGAPTEYKFEGYNVYQLETLTGTGRVKRIATYDKINGVRKILDDVFVPEHGKHINIFVQYGSDSGLSHSIQITQDALNNNSNLKINREYYFAVTAYSYNKYGIPKTLESLKEIIAVRPQIPNTWSANSDTVQHGYYFEAEHTNGTGDGSVSVTVVDPTQITGNDYKVAFNDYLINSTDTLNITNWDLTNTTTGEIVLSNQVIIGGINRITGDTLGINSSPVIDGFQVIVNGGEPDIDYVAVVANANGPLTYYKDGVPPWRYPDWLGAEIDYSGPSVITGAIWFLNTHPGYGPGGPETFYNSVVVFSGGDGSSNQGIAAIVPYDFECRFTGQGKAYDYWGGTGINNVPFEWWNIGFGTPGDLSDDYKLISYFIDDDGNEEWGLTPFDHETSGGDNDPYTDRIYVMAPTNNTPGTHGHDDFFGNVLTDGSNVAHWTSAPGENDPSGPMDTWNVFSRLVFMNWNGGDVANHPNYNASEPETGTVFRIVTTKPNTSSDEFTFSTASLVGKTIEYDPSNIKIWPNPYFGYNPEEINTDDRQIHFTHLPEDGKCIIRIFDLAGSLVRKIVHNNGTQYEIWDVRDYHTNPVASGMYIVHIETVQGEKILKLAVVQPQL